MIRSKCDGPLRVIRGNYRGLGKVCCSTLERTFGVLQERANRRHFQFLHLTFQPFKASRLNRTRGRSLMSQNQPGLVVLAQAQRRLLILVTHSRELLDLDFDEVGEGTIGC